MFFKGKFYKKVRLICPNFKEILRNHKAQFPKLSVLLTKVRYNVIIQNVKDGIQILVAHFS